MARHKWLRSQLIRKHEGRCYLCGLAVVLGDETSPRYATLDHVVPLSRGGRDAPDNLALACQECNVLKKDRLLGELAGG